MPLVQEVGADPLALSVGGALPLRLQPLEHFALRSALDDPVVLGRAQNFGAQPKVGDLGPIGFLVLLETDETLLQEKASLLAELGASPLQHVGHEVHVGHVVVRLRLQLGAVLWVQLGTEPLLDLFQGFVRFIQFFKVGLSLVGRSIEFVVLDEVRDFFEDRHWVVWSVQDNPLQNCTDVVLQVGVFPL